MDSIATTHSQNSWLKYMHELFLFVSLIEIRPLAGSNLNPSEIAGAAVRCYLLAETSDQAIQYLQESLADNCLDLVEIEWCVNESEVEWERPGNKEAAKLRQDARNGGGVMYGEFHVWGHEEAE